MNAILRIAFKFGKEHPVYATIQKLEMPILEWALKR